MADVVDGEETKCFALKTDKAFSTFFHSLDEQANLVRLFERRGGSAPWYSAHGKDAKFLAECFFKSNGALRSFDKTAGSLPLQYVAVRSGAEFNSVVQMLLGERKMRVEVWSHDGSKWALSKRGSPGNIDQFEDVLDTVRDPPVAVAAIVGSKDGACVVGMAFAETTSRVLYALEFPDDDQLSNFECALMQFGAKECYIAESEKDFKARKMNTVLQKAGIPVIPCKRSDFGGGDIEQDLKTLLGNEAFMKSISELDKKSAMGALSCIIRKLELLQEVGSDATFRLAGCDLSRYMKLDYTATKALSLVPGPGEGSGSMNLFNLLDKCKTPMGSRRLLRWIKQPLLDHSEIERRLDFVELFVNDTELRTSMRDNCLRGIGDIDRTTKKFVMGKAGLQDVVAQYDNVKRIQNLAQVLSEYQGEHSESLMHAYVAPLKALAVDKCCKYIEMVESVVDLDLAEKEHRYEIRASFNDELKGIDEKRRELRAKMAKLAEQAACDLGVKQVKLVDSQWGMVLRITKTDEKKLRDQRDYKVLDKKGAGSSGSAQVRFTCDKLESYSRKLEVLNEEFQSVASSLEAEVLKVARSFSQPLEQLSDLVADLDVYLSVAHVSAASNYVRPKMTEIGTGDIVLLDSRHPCVEVSEGVSFIANDVSLVRGQSQFQIITGPNMGGKSTYIRQVGVIAVMAQMGCFVPCREARMSVVDCVMCRVGAGDSQLRGISTFMAEMLETASILNTATAKSLVIIDELGRGTSTYDGFGLAWSISEYICNKIGALCFFATHFHELTALADKIPFVRNLHVTADTVAGRLVLQYKVQEGPCDRSFGIHVAELADFPKSVIDVARRKASELEDFAPKKKFRLGDGSASPAPAEPVDFEKLLGEGNDSLLDVPGVTKEERESGLREMAGVLKSFSDLPLDKMQRDEALAAARALSESFARSGNPYVKKLLAAK
eukprot:m51a1_g8141 putative dna mismatch repair protein msh2 (947) ;mRNA; r:24655-28218